MKQALIVLGMHRSGTSSVAGTLSLLGASSPKTLMPAHPDNQKGYWESAPLVALNDRILESGGSKWSDWRTFNPEWQASAAADALKSELGELIAQEFGDSPLIVLKDPRLCRLFPIWKDALHAQGFRPNFLIPLRSPIEISASLSKRDGFTPPRSLLIWLRNMLDAERASRDEPRVLFHWSDFMQDWRGEIERLSDKLALTFPARSDLTDAQVDQFLDHNLRRHVSPDRLPAHADDWLRRVDLALHRLVSDPNDASTIRDLDAVREEFDASSNLYGAALAGLENEVSAQAERYHGLAVHCNGLQQGYDHLQAHIAGVSQASENRIAELTHALHLADQNRHEIASARAAEQVSADKLMAGLRDTNAALTAQHAASIEHIAELEAALNDVSSAYQAHQTQALNQQDEDRRRLSELQATIAEAAAAHHNGLAEVEKLYSERLAQIEESLANAEEERRTMIDIMKRAPIRSALRIAVGRNLPKQATPD